MNELWYCVRSKTKQEHMAAAGLRKLEGLEVFCPRLRFQRPTRRGPVWFNEALFPGYLFARFDLHTQMKAVMYARGVLGLVHFGAHYADVPEAVMAALRRQMDATELKVVSLPLAVGDMTRIIAGPMAGLEALVQQLLPARERVKVLRDFLGRRVEAEVEPAALMTPWAHPLKAV